MLTLAPAPRRRAARAARRATSHERASAVSGPRRSTARRANSGWASRRRLNFGLRSRLASREGASRNARPRRRQMMLDVPTASWVCTSHGAVARRCAHRGGVVEKRFTRRKAARPLNVRLDAIQPFCRLFPRCRAYSCGVPRHPLLIGRLHCARASWKLSSRWGRKYGTRQS